MNQTSSGSRSLVFGIGRRLWLAFGIVIGCTAGGGAVSLAISQQAMQHTDHLVEVSIPSQQRIASAQSNLLRMALGFRVFGASFIERDYQTGLGFLEAVKADVEQLVERSAGAEPEMMGEVNDLRTDVSQLEELAAQTKQHADALLAAQELLVTNTAAAAPVFKEHRECMQAKLAAEITGGSPPEDLTSRVSKLATTNEAEQLFQSFVQAVFQGMAKRDPTHLDVIVKQLPVVLDSLQRLRKQHSKPDDWVRVDRLTKLCTDFGTAAAELKSRLVALNSVNRERAALVDRKIQRLETLGTATGSALVTQLGSVQSGMRHSLWAIAGSALLAIVIGVLSSVLLARQVVGPVRRATTALAGVAEGDLSVRLAPGGNDELGLMAVGLNATVDRLRHHRQATGDVAEELQQQAQALTGSSQTLTRLGQDTATQATAVATAAEQVSAHVATVAAAAEELSVSVHEVARSSSEAAQVTTEARKLSEHAQGVIGKLSSSSTQISTVARDIESIAQKTNLLALNATIEAASAGEAGRGFAVVANEVKDLARQTAAATADITRRIKEIQTGTADAVGCLGDIAVIIGKIDGFEQAISAAVQQQATTTDEITRTATTAAQATTAIVGTIQQVATGVGSATATTADISRIADDLTHQAEKLQVLVGEMRLG